jgi:hypothetical protein
MRSTRKQANHAEEIIKGSLRPTFVVVVLSCFQPLSFQIHLAEGRCLPLVPRGPKRTQSVQDCWNVGDPSPRDTISSREHEVLEEAYSALAGEAYKPKNQG